MNAVNAVLLFIQVWTFTAVCQADKDISVSCDVTGSVGKEVTLSCSVSLLINDCCITKHFFECNDSKFCKLEPPDDSCEKNNSFICPYSPITRYTGSCSFFVQTSCGWDKAELKVDITGSLRHKNPENRDEAADLGFKYTGIAVASSALILIIIIIFTIIIYKTTSNSTKSSGFKRNMFLVVRRDVDNSDHKKFVI